MKLMKQNCYYLLSFCHCETVLMTKQAFVLYKQTPEPVVRIEEPCHIVYRNAARYYNQCPRKLSGFGEHKWEKQPHLHDHNASKHNNTTRN